MDVDIEEDENKDAPYFCEISGCDFSTNKWRELVDHDTVHQDPGRIFICEYCDNNPMTTKNEFEFKMHLASHADECLFYECHICNYFQSRDLGEILAHHQIEHSKKPPLIEAQIFSSRNNNLKKILDSKSRRERLSRARSRAESWPPSVADSEDLLSSEFISKPIDRIKTNLIIRIPRLIYQRALSITPSKSSAPPFTSAPPMPPDMPTTQIPTSIGLREVFSESSLKCPQLLCEYWTNDPSKLRQHQVNHMVFARCEKCPYVCRRTRLAEHSRLHNVQDRIDCDLCYFIAINQMSMGKHMRASHRPSHGEPILLVESPNTLNVHSSPPSSPKAKKFENLQTLSSVLRKRKSKKQSLSNEDVLDLEIDHEPHEAPTVPPSLPSPPRAEKRPRGDTDESQDLSAKKFKPNIIPNSVSNNVDNISLSDSIHEEIELIFRNKSGKSSPTKVSESAANPIPPQNPSLSRGSSRPRKVASKKGIHIETQGQNTVEAPKPTTCPTCGESFFANPADPHQCLNLSDANLDGNYSDRVYSDDQMDYETINKLIETNIDDNKDIEIEKVDEDEDDEDENEKVDVDVEEELVVYYDLEGRILIDRPLRTEDSHCCPKRDCQYWTNSSDDLESHLENHKHSFTGCSQCPFVGRGVYAGRDHEELHGPGFRRYRCPRCYFIAGKFSKLSKHEEVAHGRLISSTDNCLFDAFEKAPPMCPTCGQMFDTSSQCNAHVANHPN